MCLMVKNVIWGESNMWQGNSELHKISDERKQAIDKKRIANGLQPFWSNVQTGGESL